MTKTVDPLLVVAHPGHEISLYGWCLKARPQLCFLTTGSRSGSDRTRLEACAASAQELGMDVVDIHPPFLDRDLYAAIMQADTRRLTTWMEALANHIEGSGTRLVVTDAWQGYSPAHDLVHLMTRTAVTEAEQKLGRSVTLVEHAPVPEDEWPRQARTAPFETCQLDESTAAAKLETAQSHEDLRQEIEAIGATRSPHMLAVERLYYVDRQLDLQRLYTQTPYFERIGRERVKAGIYTSALTAEHMRRVARLLCANLEETVRAV